jgi:hypothetical protein
MIAGQQPPDLVRERREQLRRGRPVRDERREAPKPRLLLREPAELAVALLQQSRHGLERPILDASLRRPWAR